MDDTGNEEIIRDLQRYIQLMDNIRRTINMMFQPAIMPLREIAQPELDFSREITHPAPMTSHQIRNSIETRSQDNQDIKFLEKTKCGVCLGSWKEILVDEDHLVFLQCGHVFCRKCAVRFSAGSKRECPVCRKKVGPDPPFRRLHIPLDPRLKKNRD